MPRGSHETLTEYWQKCSIAMNNKFPSGMRNGLSCKGLSQRLFVTPTTASSVASLHDTDIADGFHVLSADTGTRATRDVETQTTLSLPVITDRGAYKDGDWVFIEPRKELQPDASVGAQYLNRTALKRLRQYPGISDAEKACLIDVLCYGSPRQFARALMSSPLKEEVKALLIFDIEMDARECSSKSSLLSHKQYKDLKKFQWSDILKELVTRQSTLAEVLLAVALPTGKIGNTNSTEALCPVVATIYGMLMMQRCHKLSAVQKFITATLANEQTHQKVIMPNDKDRSTNKGNNGGNNGGSNWKDTNVNPHSENNQIPTIYPYPQPGFFPSFGLPAPISPHIYRQPYPAPSYPTQQDDTHSDKLIELFQEMNSRLKSIEHTVTKIGPMEKDLTYLKTQMCKMNDSNTLLSRRVAEVEKSCQFSSEIIDGIVSTHEATDGNINELKHRNSILEAQMQSLMSKNIELNSRCLDIQSKHMENDLIIFGVKEARPDGGSEYQRENVQSILKDSLTSNLIDNSSIPEETKISLENLNFENVYRVGYPVKAKHEGRSRPIIAKFETLKDRNKVRKAGIVLNQINQASKNASGIKIYEHFPREIEERRKVLYPIVRQLSEQGETVSLVKDRLYINRKLFNINNGAYTDRYGRTCYVRPRNPPTYPVNDGRRNQRPHYASENGWNPRQSGTNSTHYGPNPGHYHQNQAQFGSKPTQSVSYTEQITQNFDTRPLNQGPYLPSRTLTFETPSRYDALSMDVDRIQQKRKERSPLVGMETDTKRQNTNDSLSNENNPEDNNVISEHDSATQQNV